MESILELHGAGMERMMELVAESGQAGDAAIRRFANDILVASLLVLHDLHPDDMETRVRQVLSKQSLHAELAGIFDGVVRVRSPPGAVIPTAMVRSRSRPCSAMLFPMRRKSSSRRGLQQNGFVPLAALNSLSAGTIRAKG